MKEKILYSLQKIFLAALFAATLIAAPVLASSASKTKPLTISGIVFWTNVDRITENPSAPYLNKNYILNAIASARLDDMFKRQYFDHVSPTGIAPSDIAIKFGYRYLTFSENIALGTYQNDQALVTAWMNSPHHRKNIISPKFREIGVAARVGIYKNRRTWIAVQVFGRSASDCPSPSSAAKNALDTVAEKIAEKNSVALPLYELLRSNSPQTSSEITTYNQNVQTYDSLVQEINILKTEFRQRTNEFNVAVKAYNTCLAK